MAGCTDSGGRQTKTPMQRLGAGSGQSGESPGHAPPLTQCSNTLCAYGQARPLRQARRALGHSLGRCACGGRRVTTSPACAKGHASQSLRVCSGLSHSTTFGRVLGGRSMARKRGWLADRVQSGTGHSATGGANRRRSARPRGGQSGPKGRLGQPRPDWRPHKAADAVESSP